METIQKERITKESAIKMLENNKNNRNVLQTRIKRYAQDMRSGLWITNGETIKIDEDGNILDGQHRLYAVVETGITIECYVIRGLPRSCFNTIDIGAPRSSASIFQIAGYKHYTNLSAMSKMLYFWRKAQNPFADGSVLTISHAALLESIDNEDELLFQAAAFGDNKNFLKKIIPPRMIGFCFYVFSKKSPDDCIEFFELLNSGEPGYEGGPILFLRDQLLLDVGAKKKMSVKYKCALIFKAFKIFIQKKQVKMLRVNISGEHEEKDLFII
jgi:hypothetical protein